jgi:hypothetical protein
MEEAKTIGQGKMMICHGGDISVMYSVLDIEATGDEITPEKIDEAFIEFLYKFSRNGVTDPDDERNDTIYVDAFYEVAKKGRLNDRVYIHDFWETDNGKGFAVNLDEKKIFDFVVIQTASECNCMVIWWVKDAIERLKSL